MPATRLESCMETVQGICTRDNVAHSRITHHQLLLGNWNILTSQEKSWSGKQSGIISIFSEFLQPKDVSLNLWKWMENGNSSILVLILVCLLKRVWRFSQAPGCLTLCQIGSCEITGLYVYCRYMPPMLRVNIRLLWMK